MGSLVILRHSSLFFPPISINCLEWRLSTYSPFSSSEIHTLLWSHIQESWFEKSFSGPSPHIPFYVFFYENLHFFFFHFQVFNPPHKTLYLHQNLSWVLSPSVSSIRFGSKTILYSSSKPQLCLTSAWLAHLPAHGCQSFPPFSGEEVSLLLCKLRLRALSSACHPIPSFLLSDLSSLVHSVCLSARKYAYVSPKAMWKEDPLLDLPPRFPCL